MSVFISYAREDQWHAEKLYMDLRLAEIDVWIDSKCLLPGMNWDNTIKKTIQAAKYFIFFVSSNSNQNDRYLKRELDLAIEIQTKRQEDEVYIIPVRLEEIDPANVSLMKHNFIDIYKSYDKGLGRILTAIADVAKESLELRGHSPYVGKRESISFEPFKDYENFIGEILRSYPVSSILIEKKHALYFTYDTTFSGVDIPDYLRVKYPKTMTLVLQHQYEDFNLFLKHLTIKLAFNGVKETLTIPYNAIFRIDSTMGFKIEKVDGNKI